MHGALAQLTHCSIPPAHPLNHTSIHPLSPCIHPRSSFLTHLVPTFPRLPIPQTAQYSTQIFSLAVLLSSLFVYNHMGGIDESALDRLSLVTEMTKHIRVRAGQGECGCGCVKLMCKMLCRSFRAHAVMHM